jgi:transcriptional regulator with XRE-family HTH domain
LTYQARILYYAAVMNESARELGRFLKHGRTNKGLSLRAVEESTGVSNAYLSQLESGRIRKPSPVDLHKLCVLYDLPYTMAMEYAGYPLPDGTPPTTSNQRLLARLGRTTREEEDAIVEYMEFLRSKKGRRR